MQEYLTTRELAELLRIKERKVYDLAAAGEVPCARVTGKLLFPAAAVRAWLDGNRETQARPRSRPAVLLGSHDPLLERGVRDSRCALATLLDGSADGLARFAAGEGVACGLHLRDSADGGWNVRAVEAHGIEAAVLVRFATRRRGLVSARGSGIDALGDLAGRRVAARQPGSGAQGLFEQLLNEAGLALDAADAGDGALEPARSETDAVLRVVQGEADVAFGLESVALEYGLGFAPLVDERFDVLVDRRAWFEPPWQALLDHWRSDAFRELAAARPGHDVGEIGRVVWNA